MNRVTRLIAVSILGTGLTAGCAPVIEAHGYAPPDEEVADIQAGRDTRGSVQRKIGRPSATGVFTDSGWYYVATKIERETYKKPKVIDRRIVAVTFDENDVVARVDTFGLQDGRVIDLETRTTPTSGQQLTIVEQVIGNIGTSPLSDLTGSSDN